MTTVKMGVIGLGVRGSSILKKILLNMDDVEITSVCDNYEDRAIEMADAVYEKRGKRPEIFTDHYTCLQHGNMDAVFIATSWETHVEVAIDAMKLGIPVALEVGGAYCVERMWDMVRTYEETKTPLMFMELLLRQAGAACNLAGPQRDPRRHRSRTRCLRALPGSRYCKRCGSPSLPPAQLSHAQLRKLSHARAGTHRKGAEHQPRQPDGVAGFGCLPCGWCAGLHLPSSRRVPAS